MLKYVFLINGEYYGGNSPDNIHRLVGQELEWVYNLDSDDYLMIRDKNGNELILPNSSDDELAEDLAELFNVINFRNFVGVNKW